MPKKKEIFRWGNLKTRKHESNANKEISKKRKEINARKKRKTVEE
jgi:hypothetical protein